MGYALAMALTGDRAKGGIDEHVKEKLPHHRAHSNTYVEVQEHGKVD